ncbi:type III pantothenate kinase [Flocculibacter collagenilyticus]|uniref:type III pantothenate kinase n=1 Tax=Flocculibacter collagenilyticus TaxID=2744479 RepID=UPI0018F4146A|nr:type III pantothenate kinase [Flocculibacter collagenilyticus]
MSKQQSVQLLIDIGNTASKSFLYYADKKNSAEKFIRVPCEYAHIPFNDIQHIYIASVSHCDSVSDIVAEAANRGVGTTHIVTEKKAFGVECAYKNYQTLGIDRWLAILGSVEKYPETNLIIVDAGTATTVDIVSYHHATVALPARTIHLGGWIAPGIDLMLNSITQNTKKVFSDSETEFKHEFGKNTPQALKSGVLASQCGLIRHAISLAGNEYKILITGGNASLIVNGIDDIETTIEPLLVFEGLARFSNKQ